MRRIAAAALLLLAGTGVASGNPGPCTFGYGCGGHCFRLFPRMHQEGPLFNYGPYYGYPPFEPYGYWNAYLQYTGPVGGHGGGGWGGGGCGPHGCNKLHHANPHPWFGHHGGDCASGHCGRSIFDGSLLNGGLGGSHLHHEHKPKTCHNCGSVAAADIDARPVLERYAGYGEPVLAAAYYVNTPGLTDPEAVMPVALIGR
jgi:hypothetical protein